MEQGFIFGGNTPWSYEDLQRKKAQAAQVAASLSNTPRNVGEGLHAIGKALMVRGLEKRASRREGELKGEADDIWSSVFSGIGGGSTAPGFSPTASMPPSVSTTNPEGKAVADDTMRALGMPVQASFDTQGVDPTAMSAFQALQSSWGQPLKVNSAYRSPEHNAKVGGAKHSQHTHGKAFDVDVAGMSEAERLKLIETAKASGFKGVGVYNNSLHFDVGPERAWGPSYKSDSIPQWAAGAVGGGGVPGGQVAQNIAGVQAIAQAMGNPMIQRDPGKMAVLEALLGQALKEPETMTPYQQAQIDLKRQEMEADASGANTEYGLTPQFITTPDGGLQMIQLSKDGTAKTVDLPEGAAIQKGVEKLDLGTTYQWYNTITGEPIGEAIPKNLREAEAEKAAGSTEGKAAAEAVIAAPEVIAKAQEMKALIDSVIDDPALDSIVGNVQGRLPAGIPFITGGQAGTDVSVKIRQIGGKAFLEAFETLKGGGQITEKEGQAAKDAIARLERAQSEAEYRSALRELKAIADRAVLRAQGKLGIEPEAAAPTSKRVRFNPETGELE